jgi:RNA polymerase sigma factor (sigma-70 family)
MPCTDVGDNVSKTLQRAVPDPTAAPPPSTRFADPSDLVREAIDGNRDAWDSLVTRYTPLVLQITRRYRLSASDANDVCQVVWLQVLQYLDRLREPRALPGWIATTARNESVRLITSERRTLLVDPLTGSQLESAECGSEIDDGLLAAERRDALRNGLAELKPQQREFLLLVCADPPISYDEISGRLGIPVGSIGPTRARCLAKLRATSSVAALMQP